MSAQALRITEPVDRLPAKPATPPAPPALVAPDQEWIPVAVVAQILSQSERHLRRRCEGEWREHGLARFEPGPSGRRTWHVHRSVDPALLRAHVPGAGEARRSAMEQLMAASRARRDEAQRKAAVLVKFRAWRSLASTQVTRDYAAFVALVEAAGLGPAPSLRMLYEWDASCPGSSDEPGIAASLLDRRKGPSGGCDIEPEAWALFRAYYLDPRQWSIAKCWREVDRVARSKSPAWAWPRVRRVQLLAEARITPSERDRHRLGLDEWRRRYEAPIEQAPDAWEAGECWEADHTRCDFFVRVMRGGRWVADRPWITAWLDRRSRALVGWCMGFDHNTTTIRAALLSALRDGRHSVPKVAWLDNGLDFASREMAGTTKAQRRARGASIDAEQRGVLTMLGIEPRFAQPYNHNGKARIERFFGTVHADFDREFPSWSGSAPGDRDRATLKAALADPAKLPTLDEARGRFAAWAEAYNHRAAHAIDDLVDGETGERLSPLAFYERFVPSRRVARDDALALLEQPWSQPIAVTKSGVGLRLDGRVWRYGAGMPELEPLIGTDERVLVTYDASDLNRVRVFRADGRFLCLAPLNERHGGVADDPLRREAVKEAHKRRRAHEKRLRERLDIDAAALSDADLARSIQREKDVAAERERIARETRRDPATLPPMRLVGTAFDGQSAEVERAEQRARRAVGEGPRADDFVDFGELAARHLRETTNDHGAEDDAPLGFPRLDDSFAVADEADDEAINLGALAALGLDTDGDDEDLDVPLASECLR